MTTLLAGVEAADPAIYGGVAALLSMVVLVVCYIPAARGRAS